jgi:organic hydroperoxide reductase OsmC/OhrA
MSHHYAVAIEWTGNRGAGTSTYTSYGRDHTARAAGKPDLALSSDRAFRGDAARYNPEDLLVAALSSCHMLSYLHVCASNGVVVLAYEDAAEGEMELAPDGSGHFVRAVLRPKVTIARGSGRDRAHELHEEAHHKCFIANSVNFPVEVEAEVIEAEG